MEDDATAEFKVTVHEPMETTEAQFLQVETDVLLLAARYK